jgi:Ca2+-binding RTX toxin-like protein
VNVTANNLGDIITGNEGSNILIGGTGGDTLIGGGGYDTYRLASSFGQTVINNADPGSSTAANGEIDFGAGSNSEQLWFMQSGNNLVVDQIGTSNQLTIQGWYAGNNSAEVQSFDTADGAKLDSQIRAARVRDGELQREQSGLQPRNRDADAERPQSAGRDCGGLAPLTRHSCPPPGHFVRGRSNAAQESG